MRAFSPSRLGGLECDAWIGYYRRQWGRVLRASLGLVQEGFGLRGGDAIRGAWWVLRANQVWAPYPNNNPDAARAYMTRFYALVADRSRAAFDPTEAARLDVDWWAVHRARQHGDPATLDALGDAVALLYSHAYGVDIERVRGSGHLRGRAMDVCDRWVDGGCDPASPLVAGVRDLLVRSYVELRVAIAR